MSQTKCDTLLVHCSDHRLAHACESFVENVLEIKDYDLLSVPGGPQFLCALEYLPKFNWAGRRWLNFLIEGHGVSHIILIAHEDCGWYRNLHGTHEQHEARQKEDLRRARADLLEYLPSLRVETYFASSDGTETKFTSLE